MNRLVTRLANIDVIQLICAVGLCTVSLVSLYILGDSRIPGGAGYADRAALTQAAAVLAGVGAYLIIILTGGKAIRKLAPAAFILTLIPVVMTLVGFGITVDDDTAWLSVAGISVQPSELLKVSMIPMLSYALTINAGKGARYGLFALTALISCALVFLQKDIGTLLIFTVIVLNMLFCSGVSKRLWAAVILLSPAVGYGVWRFILNADQRGRIRLMLDPSLDPYGIGYQQLSARNAIASGGLTGRLTGGGRSFVYVSSAHNDFILSFIAQLAGVLGIAAVCVMLAVLLYRTAPRSETGGFEFYVRTGVFTLFASEALINTAMNLSLFPVVGIPLPFVSAGGTAAAAAFIALGLSQARTEPAG